MSRYTVRDSDHRNMHSNRHSQNTLGEMILLRKSRNQQLRKRRRQNQLELLLELIRTKVLKDENKTGKALYHVIEPIKPPLESEKLAHSSITTTPINSPHDDQPTTSTGDNISTTAISIIITRRHS